MIKVILVVCIIMYEYGDLASFPGQFGNEANGGA